MLRLFLLVVLFTLSAAAAAWEASAPHPAYTDREAAGLHLASPIGSISAVG
jgi:hypothetical protein